MSRKDLSFAEYMADLGVGDHTKLFDKRGEDGEFNDDDIAKILSKGYTDKQTERLINKYTNTNTCCQHVGKYCAERSR